MVANDYDYDIMIYMDLPDIDTTAVLIIFIRSIIHVNMYTASAILRLGKYKQQLVPKEAGS